MYIRLKAFIAQQPKQGRPRDEVLPPELLGSIKRFTIASLPATTTPGKLRGFYFKSDSTGNTEEDIRRGVHDLFTFKIQPQLTETEFERMLGEGFRNSPFVVAFIVLLQREQSLRFGAVKDWMHELCEDVPLPYRWELNENVRIFYDWLAYFFPEVSWDRPNFSQVIYWRQT